MDALNLSGKLPTYFQDGRNSGLDERGGKKKSHHTHLRLVVRHVEHFGLKGNSRCGLSCD